ncbi:PREDICTED: uncharacterized protein LOC106297643 [Brassica oleracea var. oleracea]|uniref:uncharacterized protein LOC106297643 n=1 Tax=Brassica oleracea var. oleracea TaxID=109376 RepID=UPI0006A6F3F4|nr:PREDICTED: uncharacterized protein LOC106297643 [Brassica oleracea var. oleracea]
MSVKLIFWNVRGLNDPNKHRSFVSWLNTNKPLFGALCPTWKFYSNHNSDPDGRIILIWGDTLNVQILSQSCQCITCKLCFPNQQSTYYSALYASNLSSDLADLWRELIHLQSTLDLDNNSWILGGDLNQIIHPMEHSDPDITVPDYLMFQLRDCFTQLGLFDLRFIGPTFTWINSHPSFPIPKKYDRLMVNNSFVASFPHAISSFLPPFFSDHSPCVLDLAFSLSLAGSKPYKFQNYLIKHPGFIQLLQDAWIRTGNVCQTLPQMCWKLKQIKSALNLLSKDNYSKIQERVSETNSLLQIAHVQALQNPYHAMFQAERDLHQKWNFLREIEEMFFRQKSRNN